MLAQHERLLAPLMQPQWVGFAQIDSIMRRAKRFDDFCVRVSRANPLGQSPTRLPCDCSPSPARFWWAETAAQAAADSLSKGASTKNIGLIPLR